MVAVINVHSKFTDTEDRAIAYAVVYATLIGPTIIAGQSVARQVSTYTDVNGLWTLPLIPNTNFSTDPLASWYLIRVGSREEYRVSVPAYTGSNGSIEVTTISYPGAATTPDQAIFIGNALFEGDVMVRGNLDVSGVITADTVTLVTDQTIPSGTKTTFFTDLQIVGNLKVTGALRYTGTLTNPAYV